MIATETQSADPAATWASTVFKYERQFDCCGFSPCGKYVFAGAYDGTVQRWKLEPDTTAGSPISHFIPTAFICFPSIPGADCVVEPAPRPT